MKFFEKIKNFLAVSVARKIIAIVLCVVIIGGAATGIILGVSSCNGSSAGGDSTGDSTGPHDTYDNENDPLIFSTLAVDGVFNPFFYTSGTDGTVLGMTQLSLLTNDENGNPAYGDDEEVIAKDVKIVNKSEATGDTTTYYFVLKNNIKFSNGSPLTMKDVLFNYYVYLDPVYSGSSTMYSTDIVGLKEYRTQSEDVNEQENFMAQFETKASERIDALVNAIEETRDALGGRFSSETQLKNELEKYSKTHADIYKNIVADYNKAVGYFEEELKSDFNAAKGAWSDLEFYYKDSNNKKFKSDLKLTSDIEMFLYNEGIIEWVEKADKDNPKGRFNYQISKDQIQKLDQAGAIELVRQNWLPNKADQVVQYWSATSSNLFSYLTGVELSNYYSDSSKRTYKNIEGIKFENKDAAFTFTDNEGKSYTYEKPEYAADGSVIKGNEVLSITINKVDPKAIWNFGIGVAPMYYYSNAEQIAKFDYEENFGVDYGNSDFFENVLKNSEKNGVPVGAGAYAAATKANGLLKTATSKASPDELIGLARNEKGLFNSNSDGVIYYERNPYYDLAQNKNDDGSDWTKTAPDGKNYHVAKINKIRYSVLSANNMIESLQTDNVDFIEPNATPDTMKTLNNNGIEHTEYETSGYGYIGINAGKVPGIHVRRAIMHALDTNECVKYYQSMAVAINRPMSTTNWAYPNDIIPYYPYIGGAIPKGILDKTGKNYKYAVYSEYRDYILELISKGVLNKDEVNKGNVTLKEENQIEYLQRLVGEDGYTLGGSGIYSRNSNGKTDELKYTFTVAGDSNDHPAFGTMTKAKQLLNKVGFSITVKNDKDALLLLASGGLTVWAAAWSSTIDPDMYQVYHKDSKATSVLNWGYREILANAGGKYDTEKSIVVELSKLIDQGRESTDQKVRKPIYGKALDKIMELAVELPTYQRQDLYAYNQYKIDAKTFYQNPTSFKGLTSTLTSMSLIER